jgi:hypothetical protein
LIYFYNATERLFLKEKDFFFPTLIKGTGKKIFVDINNIVWSDAETPGDPSPTTITVKFILRQKNKIEAPKYIYDILNIPLNQTINGTQEHFFKINTPFKNIIGVAVQFSGANDYFSLKTNNVIIYKEMPVSFFKIDGVFSERYFVPILINKINNIDFSIQYNGNISNPVLLFLVRKPFVQPY